MFEVSEMSIFEIIMLLCFGAAWPVSVYKSCVSRKNSGKSIVFLIVILIGYIAGIIHKIINSMDLVICLYILNALMVSVDIAFYIRNKKYEE